MLWCEQLSVPRFTSRACQMSFKTIFLVLTASPIILHKVEIYQMLRLCLVKYNKSLCGAVKGSRNMCLFNAAIPEKNMTFRGERVSHCRVEVQSCCFLYSIETVFPSGRKAKREHLRTNCPNASRSGQRSNYYSDDHKICRWVSCKDVRRVKLKTL